MDDSFKSKRKTKLAMDVVTKNKDGFIRIWNLAVVNRLPEPEFYEERDSFKVIFRNSETKLDQQVSGQVSEQVSEQVLRYRELTIKYCKTAKHQKKLENILE